MAFVKVRIPRTSQPQDACGIDWSNPITKGLAAAVSGGLAYDYVTNTALASVGLSSAVTPFGMAATVSASEGSRIELPFEVSGAITVFALASRDGDTPSSGVNKVQVLASNRTASQSTFWEINLGNGWGADADKNKPRFSTSTVGIGSIYINGALDSGNNPSDTSLVSGHFYSVAFVAASGAPSSGSGKTWLFGESGIYALNGRVPLILLFSRALSADEVASLSSNPWQIFEPEEQWIWVPDVSSSTVDNLIPKNIVLTAVDVSKPVVAQVHALVG